MVVTNASQTERERLKTLRTYEVLDTPPDSEIQDTSQLKQVATVCGWSNRIKINGEWMSFTEFLTIHLGVAVTQELHPEAIREFIAGIDRENT